MKNKIFLVDASNLVYRAYHTFKYLKNSKGYMNGGLYGFISILSSYSQNLMTNRFIVLWDEQDTWRREIYPGYKKRRMEKKIEKQNNGEDENFKQIMKDVRRFCEYAGIISLSRKRFEADDLMSIVVRKLGNNVSMITADKDMCQLVNDKNRIEIVHPAKKGFEIWTEKQVEKHYGVEAKYLDLYLSLRGDGVDEIPGIKGYGEKTAQDVTNRKKSFDNIKNHLRKTIGKETVQQYEMNYKLITLKNNNFLNESVISPKHFYTIKEGSKESLKRFLKEVEIKKFTPDGLFRNFSLQRKERLQIIRNLLR